MIRISNIHFVLVIVLCGSSCNSDNVNTSKQADSGMSIKNNNTRIITTDHEIPNLTNWPAASQMAVKEITDLYGKPDGAMADELIWINKGPWKKICITKMESKHSFPIEHTDMMTTTIGYDVPEEKMDDLGMFDGSVTFDRTQGTMSARCDKEGNNFLALNLANDIITNKKTVAAARKSYGDIVKEKMNGGNPEYMLKLTFSPASSSGDPDTNTTGLTKEQVTEGVEKNKKQ